MSLVSGSEHSCGLRTDGSVICWGRGWEGHSTEPNGEFTAIGAFRNYSCGAPAKGGIKCWGASSFPTPERLSESTQIYVSLAVGDRHLCALTSAGSVECWTDDRGMEAHLDHAPVGDFVSLDAGHSHTCGVRVDGSVVCWGGDYGRGLSVLPDEKFQTVSADHEGLTCGVKVDGAVVCWGAGGGELPASSVRDGSFQSISVNRGRVCGILTSGELLCWSDSPDWSLRGFGAPPAGSYTAISVGQKHTCASRDDGTVVCWGKSLGAMPPGGYGINELAMVYSVAAVRGDIPIYKPHPDLSNENVVTYIAVGEHNSCQWWEATGIHHFRFCWGHPHAHTPEPGTPTYRAISVGYLHNCAVTTERQAVCWGSSQSPGGGGPPPDLRRGQDDPPEGRIPGHRRRLLAHLRTESRLVGRLLGLQPTRPSNLAGWRVHRHQLAR